MVKERDRGNVATVDVRVAACAADDALARRGAISRVAKVERDGKPREVHAGLRRRGSSNVALGRPLPIGRDATVDDHVRRDRRASACTSSRRPDGRAAQAWNYGEGGLHYGWLPIYNDTNDRFRRRVRRDGAAKGSRPSPTACSIRRARTPDGTRTFRWVQEKPIPNYLVTVDVGDFVARSARPTRRSDRPTVPLSVWTPPGTEEAAKYTFGNTPQMVEFFSETDGLPVPVGQVRPGRSCASSRSGAMETTTMTGFGESHLHAEGRSARLVAGLRGGAGRSSRTRTRSRTSSRTTGSATW